jgi:WG containing repeat
MRWGRIIVFASGALLLVQAALIACSWGLPIWPKSKNSDTPLFRFVTDGRAGYINASGKIVILAKFSGASDGITGSTGYDDFYEGVANMSAYSERFINSAGLPIKISPYKLSGCGVFSGGLMMVRTWSGSVEKVGFVDHKGKLAIGLNFDEGGDFAEGLAAVSVKGKWGYIDRTGKIVIPLQLAEAAQFSEGVARVILDGPCWAVRYGPCNGGPRIVGLTEPKKAGTKYNACEFAFLDRKGTPLFPQRFKDAFNFSECLAAVGNGRMWGFINKSGVVQIPLQFEEVGSFSEGLAKVRQSGRWGYVDRTGRIVIAPQFESAEDFSAGAAVVGSPFREAWYIDKSGNKLFGRTFRAASTFRLGLAHVSDNQHDFAYINRSGARVFSYHTESQ